MYALRRIRDAFRENKNLTDTNVIESQLKLGTESLELIRRQVCL